jgi:hypothetical protein
MIDTSFQKVQVNQVISSQLPSFVQEENPLFVDFLKTYYLGEESLALQRLTFSIQLSK